MLKRVYRETPQKISDNKLFMDSVPVFSDVKIHHTHVPYATPVYYAARDEIRYIMSIRYDSKHAMPPLRHSRLPKRGIPIADFARRSSTISGISKLFSFNPYTGGK